jgi:HSP20 family protein
MRKETKAMTHTAPPERQKKAPENKQPARSAVHGGHLASPPDGPQRGPTVHYGYVWWPPVDVEETDEAYTFASDLAGVDRKDVTIELTGNELAISGEVTTEEHSDVAREQLRRSAPFAYSITLPEAVAADAIDASLENGVLKVTVPKSKPSQRQRIELH